MRKRIILAFTLMFCNVSQAAVYVIDFKCEPEAYDVFAYRRWQSLMVNFLKALQSLRDITTSLVAVE